MMDFHTSAPDWLAKLGINGTDSVASSEPLAPPASVASIRHGEAGNEPEAEPMPMLSKNRRSRRHATTEATLTAEHDFDAAEYGPEYLSLRAGEIVHPAPSSEPPQGWKRVRNSKGECGWVPPGFLVELV